MITQLLSVAYNEEPFNLPFDLSVGNCYRIEKFKDNELIESCDALLSMIDVNNSFLFFLTTNGLDKIPKNTISYNRFCFKLDDGNSASLYEPQLSIIPINLDQINSGIYIIKAVKEVE